MKQLDVKLKIVFSIALLLLAGMVLLDMVMVNAAQQLLVRSEKEKAGILVDLIGAHLLSGRRDGDSLRAGIDLKGIQSKLEPSNVAAALWVDSGRQIHWIGDRNAETASALERAVLTAENRQSVQVDSSGYTWGVFWRQKKYLIFAGPVRDASGALGAAGVSLRLDTVFSRLRSTQKFIGWYLLINTLLLSLIGIYRIHRLALRPVLKIIRRAEAFRPGDSNFTLEEYGENELSRLSKAFNRILDLNRGDQQKLRHTVSCLEDALVELKHAHHEIIRAEKLATVGRLSSGIAHEIGNPIGIVLGYLELIKQPDADETDKKDYIRRAEDEIGRIRSIIRQLLDYSRSSEEGRRPVSVHGLVGDVLQMARIQPMFADVAVDADLAAGYDIVSGDPDQLRQLFLNFFLNAADAIHMGGKKVPGLIRIVSDNVFMAGPDGKEVPGMLRLRFQDNGTGISGDDFNKIFDPFFTTKPPGMGSGLGLWVSLLIAESMGGKIDAESEPGKGTRMTLSLPVLTINAASQ